MSASAGSRAPGLEPLRPTDPPAVGRYRLLARLGAGGMGTVYLAEPPPWPGGPAHVALKVVRPEYADDPVFRERFLRETQAAARVRGPGVAAVLDADAAAPLPWLVTEYVPGPSLRQHVAAAGALRGAALDAFATGVARSLAAIHAAGVVHRDLKPANVLLGPAGPVVVDFGIARPADAVTSLTTTGEVVGSIGWMAPEVLRQHRAGPPADVFGWGAVVAYAGTGRRPFGEGPDPAVAHRVLAGPPPDLTGLPPRLAAAVTAALHPDPAGRPRAADLADALARGLPLRAPSPGRTPVPTPDPTRLAPPLDATRLAPAPGPAPRRRRLRGTGLLTAAAVVLVGVAATHRPADVAPRDGSAQPSATRSSPRTAAGPTHRPSPARTSAPAPSPAEPGYLVAAALAPARDGEVVFRLTDLRCGLTTVGTGDLAQDLPAGRSACSALVTVHNSGQGRHLLPPQWLHGPDGQGYGSDLTLTRALGRPSLEFRTLGAGEMLRSGLVWQLPAGVRPVDVELHGDLVSLGVHRRLP